MNLSLACSFWTVLLVSAVVVPAARGLWLNLPSNGNKCLSEELHNNVVVVADYYAFVGADYDVNATVVVPTITVKVTSPYGNVVYHQEKVSHGQIAFTATESGAYYACLNVDGDHGGKSVTVGLDWKTGVAAKDYDSVARKEKIEGLELKLKKFEDGVKQIHANLLNLVNRESELRLVSEITNTRVAWYSMMSLGVCIVVSFLQIWYLRRYFQKRKLI